MGATFFTLFGLLALVLAGLGIFATAAHAVATRRREMGIRMALGALPRSLLGSILRPSLGQAALGILLGTVLRIDPSEALRGE